MLAMISAKISLSIGESVGNTHSPALLVRLIGGGLLKVL